MQVFFKTSTGCSILWVDRWYKVDTIQFWIKTIYFACSQEKQNLLAPPPLLQLPCKDNNLNLN